MPTIQSLVPSRSQIPYLLIYCDRRTLLYCYYTSYAHGVLKKNDKNTKYFCIVMKVGNIKRKIFALLDE